jgi:predicted transcriptional regulator
MSTYVNSFAEKADNEFAENERRRKKKYRENIDLRRNTVQSMLIRGNTQWEIAENLGVSQPTISRDIQWLRSVAKKELRDKLEKKFPEEYYKYLVSIDEVLKNTWDIALSGFIDDKIRLDALQFVINCGKHKMDVIMNPPVLKLNSVKPFKSRSFYENTNDNKFGQKRKEIRKESI